jgi:hypothetical protein
MGRARAAEIYRTAAVIAANTALLFLLANAVAAVVLRLLPGGPRRDVAAFRGGYPGVSHAEVVARLAERDASNHSEYEAFTEFRPKAFAGRFVNVEVQGFRRGARRPPWPPDRGACSVFFFGGSTAYGDFLADAETIPAALEEAMAGATDCVQPVVYNFGRPGYYSVQERILFEQLLASGLKPRWAVFLDGLNEFYYPEPRAAEAAWAAGRSRDLAELVARRESATSVSRLRDFLEELPLLRVLHRAGRRDVQPRPTPCYAGGILDRWKANRRLAESAATTGVRILFVWQPVPVHRPGLAPPDLGRDAPRLDCARAWYALLASQPRDPGFLWLADLQDGKPGRLYVDSVHYTAAFSKEIARAIAAAMRSGR